MADELKDQRVVTMMSPSELEAIDNWMFANRIRSRGEAIRRLCQVGMIHDRSLSGFVPAIIDLSLRAEANTNEIKKEIADTDDPAVLRRAIHRLIFDSAETNLSIFRYTVAVLLETLPLRTRMPTTEAMALAKEAMAEIQTMKNEGGKSAPKLRRLLADLLRKLPSD